MAKNLFRKISSINSRGYVYRNSFLFPDNIYFIDFFVNFTFWLAISVVVIYSAEILSFKKKGEIVGAGL